MAMLTNIRRVDPLPNALLVAHAVYGRISIGDFGTVSWHSGAETKKLLFSH